MGLQATPCHGSQMFSCSLRSNSVDLRKRKNTVTKTINTTLGWGSPWAANSWCLGNFSGEEFLRAHSVLVLSPRNLLFAQCHSCAWTKFENLNGKPGKLGNGSKAKSNYKDVKKESKVQVKGSEICKTWKEERQKETDESPLEMATAPWGHPSSWWTPPSVVLSGEAMGPGSNSCIHKHPWQWTGTDTHLCHGQELGQDKETLISNPVTLWALRWDV